MGKVGLEYLRRKAALIWEIATDRRLPWRARAPAMLALAYVASPIDLVPDWLPGLGWLDDLLVVTLATVVTPLLVPSGLVARHMVRARQQRAEAALEPPLEGASALPWLMILVGTLLALAALIGAAPELGAAG
jgi:uncharacterized membrane protein YkvA (DUF1232 family)